MKEIIYVLYSEPFSAFFGDEDKYLFGALDIFIFSFLVSFIIDIYLIVKYSTRLVFAFKDNDMNLFLMLSSMFTDYLPIGFIVYMHSRRMRIDKY